MKFGIFRSEDGREFAGIILGGNVIPDWLTTMGSDGAAGNFRKLLEMTHEERLDLEQVSCHLAERGRGFQLASVTVLAPYLLGSRILCQVVNYSEHGNETRIPPPPAPFFFYKPGDAVVPTNAEILAHAASLKLDYEIELAVIIGRAGRNIAVDSAMGHVAGYLVMNDVSYRDLQFNERFPELNARFGRNWTKGKGLDGSCVLGPWVTSAEEVGNPYALHLQCWVNGILRQDASTGEMLIKIPELIAEASLGSTLRPGDIIGTGTPAGVGLSNGKFLLPGDEVVGEISRIGKIHSSVTMAS